MPFSFNTDLIFADGPTSTPHTPPKPEIRVVMKEIERAIDAYSSGAGTIAYQERTSLFANLNHAVNVTAWVYGDTTDQNYNGIYRKYGASGEGYWQKILNLPYSFIVASDLGAGAPNAIKATTSVPVSSSALVWFRVSQANTASPVTISFNGGLDLTILTNSGGDVAAGGLVAGSVVLGTISGTTFRILNDQVSSAIVAQAEAAASAALAAASAGYKFNSHASFQSATIPTVLQFVDVAGYSSAGDGGAHTKRRIPAPTPPKAWHTQCADGSWWEIAEREINPFMLGASGAPNTNDGPQLNDTMLAALALKADVYLPVYFWVSQKVTIPAGLKIRGNGAGGFRPVTTAVDLAGSGIITFGTVAKTETLDFVSNMDTGGGKILNPAFGQSGISSALSQYYELTNFTNANASGATRATLKPFSVGVHLLPGGGTVLQDVRIMLANGADGIANFLDVNSSALGADCDVGLWVENHSHVRVINTAVVGFWRMAGRLVTSIAKNADDAPSSEYGYYEGCTFQGYRGSVIRTNDIFPIISLTSTTVTIPWSASHRWPSSGSFRSGSIGTFAYTGMSFSGGQLTLTGITSTTGLAVGSALRPVGANTSSNFGFAGTTHVRCFLTGLSHQSRALAKVLGFSGASAYLEISGDTVRAEMFLQCTFLGFDEIAIFLHDCLDIQFTDCYGEGQNGKSAVGGSFDVPAGARCIASPFAGSNTRATNPCGETGNVRDLGSSWNQGLDFTPRQPSTNTPRFGSYGGLWSPRYGPDLGKGYAGSSGRQEQYIPVGETYRLGPDSGNTVIEARSGLLDIRAATGNDAVVRSGSTTILRVPAAGIAANTTAAGANVYVSGTNVLFMSTSTGALKTAVEDIDDEARDRMLSVRPVWYRSLADGDNPDWSYYGLIAEEVAALDPRLVHWKTHELVKKAIINEFGEEEDVESLVELDEPKPTGVMYERFVPALISKVMQLSGEIESLKAMISQSKISVEK